MDCLLQIENLDVSFPDERVPQRGARVQTVSGVSLEVAPGESLGVMGESGSGKSQTFLAALGLLPGSAEVRGSVRFEGRDVLNDESALTRLRGNRIGVVFQDAMTSLTPHLTIGEQIAEVLEVHRGLARGEALARARRLLEGVHIGEAEQRLKQYPHELSGGMRQRVMIAMAIACEPALIIADEPTTALDVTVQAEILALFAELRRESSSSLVLISHDAAVIAALCDRVAVFYAGRVVEEGVVDRIFYRARHPYTQALLAAVPRLDEADRPLSSIAGQPPARNDGFAGCSFAERCSRATARCRAEAPPLTMDATVKEGREHRYACHYPLTGPAP